jgi:hypothetical protein
VKRDPNVLFAAAVLRHSQKIKAAMAVNIRPAKNAMPLASLSPLTIKQIPSRPLARKGPTVWATNESRLCLVGGAAARDSSF